MHLTNYNGKYFSVEGPLNLSRSIQGRPVLYTAGSSATFVDMGTTYTDGAFIGGFSFEEINYTAMALRKKTGGKK